MPDPTRQSVSASQAPALLNQSPYATRFMLYSHFKNPAAYPLETRPDKRMAWGNRMQAAILAATAELYRLDVVENVEQHYVRRGRLGCTRDGLMNDPATGRVIVEAKSVDRDIWRRDWTETTAPPHIEIQVQCEMYAEEADRAVIAVLVGGNDLRCIERRADPALQAALVDAAERFFQALDANEPPDPLGLPMELPALTALCPVRAPEKRFVGDGAMGERLKLLHWAQDQRRFADNLAKQESAKIIAEIADAVWIEAPGARAKIARIKVEEKRCQCGALLGKAHAYDRIFVHVDQHEGEDDDAV